MNGGALLGGMGEFKGKGSFNSAERTLRDEARGPLLRMSRVVGFIFINKINALSLRDEAREPFLGGSGFSN
jgi:hypothetical protein